jgi:hypothetical protein
MTFPVLTSFLNVVAKLLTSALNWFERVCMKERAWARFEAEKEEGIWFAMVGTRSIWGMPTRR